jgi:hypothetical protein
MTFRFFSSVNTDETGVQKVALAQKIIPDPPKDLKMDVDCKEEKVRIFCE